METGTLIRITADDAGLNAQQDAILLQLARDGHLSGVSIFVTMSQPSEALMELVRLPGISIGLHLDLTDGQPLTKGVKGGFLDASDRFPAPQAFARQAALGRLRARGLLAEVQAQVAAFIDRFGRMDHFDSHRHVHRFPSVARAVADALVAASLRPRIRNLKRCLVRSVAGGSSARSSDALPVLSRLGYFLADLKRLPGLLLKARAQRIYAAAGLPIESGMLTPWPVIDAAAPDAASRWQSAFAAAPAGRWEVNFHPGWQPAEAALLRAMHSVGECER